ncbi:glycine receptor subunit alpha-2 isoform X1 [Dermatophagoides farinae]|uniref:glycine receptor subunit alpha-2 isoform X1 n=1 Tax=Dermatophagoides farinae TaxID=6954 RepID=UPI003F645487
MDRFILQFILFNFIFIMAIDNTNSNNDDDHLFIWKTDPSIYNRWLPPDNINNQPINVNISIFLFGVANIYESNNEFHLDLLLRTSWLDKRINMLNQSISQRQQNHTTTTKSVIQGGVWHLNRIWLPPIFIVNAKQPNVFNNRDEHPVLVRISQTNGLILLSKRMSLCGLNQLNFHLYPFDLQRIHFEIETNELNLNDLRLRWSTIDNYSSIYFAPDFHWNGFELIDYQLIETNITYTHTGTYSRLTAIFFIRRKFMQSLLDVYIPIALFVIVSWGSFWIEITAAPARITLGVTVMLTMVTMARSAREKLPTISYIHSLDLWILSCIIFVFASIVEYVAVNYIYHRKKRFWAKKRKHFDIINHMMNNNDKNPELSLSKTDSIINFNHYNDCVKRKTTDYKKQLKQIRIDNGEEFAYEIDRRSRILFPICFAIFNLIYWITLYAASMIEQIAIE